MLPVRSPLSVVALGSASGLLTTALVAWLLPLSLASSGFVVIGAGTLGELMPELHAHRALLLGLGVAGAGAGLVSLWGLPPYPGVGALLLLLVIGEVGALVLAAPVALLVVGLLAVNLAAWVLLVRICLAVLRMVAS